MDPTRVLIVDNWGALPHPKLAARYPNASFEVVSPEKSEHPHGHMVAECVLNMVPEDHPVEITFYPYLLRQYQERDGWLDLIRKRREEGRPFHFCNCSFGMSHGDDKSFRNYLARQWRDGAKLAWAKDALGDTVVTFAAGNSDKSRRGRPDMDDDVNYPQLPLSALPNVFVIGACDRRSVPSLFSSDGLSVFAMYWGEGVPVYDPIMGWNTHVDGTSFASPFACGDLVALRAEGKDGFLAHVLKHGWVAPGWSRGQRHRKAGFGSMIGVQRLRLPPGKSRQLAAPSPNSAPLYLDFDLAI